MSIYCTFRSSLPSKSCSSCIISKVCFILIQRNFQSCSFSNSITGSIFSIQCFSYGFFSSNLSDIVFYQCIANSIFQCQVCPFFIRSFCCLNIQCINQINNLNLIVCSQCRIIILQINNISECQDRLFHLPVFSRKQYTLSRTGSSIIDINFQSSNLSQIYTRSKDNLISASPFNILDTVLFFHHLLNISILLLIIQFKLNCRIFRNNIVHLVEVVRFHDEFAISTASFCPCTDNSTTLIFILDRTIKVIGYREVIYRNLKQLVYEAVVNCIRCVHSVSHLLSSSPTKESIRRSSG